MQTTRARRILLALGLATSSLSAAAQAYKVTNLVSDGSVPAVTTDASFLNPWAISASPTWWISTASSGYNYVVPAAGTVSFKVIVPSGSNPSVAGLPAGSVTAAGASGMVLPNGTKASFIFSTLDGTLSGWNSKLGTANALSSIVVNNTSAGASYPGLAILNVNSTTSYILAPNFGVGNSIEVYDQTFARTRLAGSFTDPNLPAGYAPFSIHVLGTQVWVAYAQRTAKAPYLSVAGAGLGIVDVFDTSGNFVQRAVTGGALNAPWGVAIAPANFGIFSNDLLIGNFGDGHINVYDPKTFGFLGQLMDSTGKPLTYASLWELLPGGTAVANTTSVSAGDTSTVYFTAGLANEAHGLLAGISNGAVSGSTPTFGFSASSSAATVTVGSPATATLSVASANGFNGTVSFSCSGLPTGATCVFSPSTVTASTTAPTTTTLTINTTRVTAASNAPRLPRHGGALLSLAFCLPLGGFMLFGTRRRENFSLRTLGALAFGVALVGGIAGCADDTSVVKPPATPAGQSNVTVTATAGAVTQTASFQLTVQ